MMRYSFWPRDQVFVKRYGFLPFSKNIGSNIRKNVSSEYSQTLLDRAKQCTTDALKTTSKRVIQKTAEATDDLIGNIIANRITKFSKKPIIK